MNKSLIKCNLTWLVLAFLIGLTGLSTLKPDFTKDLLTNNTAGIVDFFNLNSKSKTTPEAYIKRDRSYNETSAFGEE